MSDHSVNSQHGLDMGIQVVKTSTGKVEGHVPECDLERFGYGIDPLIAVERYKSFMEEERLVAVAKGEPETASWLDTDVTVHADEEFGYPLERYYLTFSSSVLATRPEQAQRLFAQYLLDMSNGVESSVALEGGGVKFEKETP